MAYLFHFCVRNRDVAEITNPPFYGVLEVLKTPPRNIDVSSLADNLAPDEHVAVEINGNLFDKKEESEHDTHATFILISGDQRTTDPEWRDDFMLDAELKPYRVRLPLRGRAQHPRPCVAWAVQSAAAGASALAAAAAGTAAITTAWTHGHSRERIRPTLTRSR